MELLEKRIFNIKVSYVVYFLAIFLVAFLVFHKTVFKGLIPFPARTLVAKYYPWNITKGYGVPFKDSDVTDAFRQQLPWKKFFIDGLKQGKLNLWNPYAFSGYPLFANLQSAYFTPFNLTYLFVDLITAWIINIILTFVLSGIFTFLFLKQLKFKANLCFLGSLGFMFSSFMIQWLEIGVIGQTAVFLPFCLYIVEKVFVQKKLKYGFLLSLGIAFSIFGGHIQTSFYLLTFVFLYFLIRTQKEKLFKLKVFIGLLMAGLLMTSVQLVPSFELYNLSSRSSLASRLIYKDFLMPLKYLITIFIPDFFGNPGVNNFWGEQFGFRAYFGISLIFFYLYAIFFVKTRFIKRLKVANLSFLFFALKNPLTVLVPYLKIPLISSSDPSRILFLYQFSSFLIALFGLQEILGFKNKNKIKVKKILISQILPIVVYLASLLFLFIAIKTIDDQNTVRNLSIALKNTILPVGVYFLVFIFTFLSFRFLKVKKALVGLIIIFSIFEYFYFANKYLSFSEKKFVFPKTFQIAILQEKLDNSRFISTIGARFEKNFSTFFSFFSPEGYDGLFSKRYGQLVYFLKDQNALEKIPRSDVDVVYFQKDRHSLSFKRLLDLLSVKYILGWAGEIPYLETELENRFKLVWDFEFSHLHQNMDSLSRFNVFKDYQVIKEDKKILSKLFSPEFNPLTEIILEEEPGIEVKDKALESKIEVLSDNPDEITLKLKTNQQAILLINDNYYPGWQAYVSNSDDFSKVVNKKIIRANYTFKAIVVDKGESFIKFIYKPKSFKIGLWLSLLGIIFIIYTSFFYIKKVK